MLDRKIFTSPPSNTTFAYAQTETQEELSNIYQHIVQEISVTNTGNALTAISTPALTAYTDTKYYMLVVPAANTGAMSLNIDGLGARPLVSSTNSILSAGDVSANQAIMVYMDTSINAFRIIGSTGGGISLPTATQQYQVLQADAALSWVPSQEIYSGNF
jgi:hypothetical protein